MAEARFVYGSELTYNDVVVWSDGVVMTVVDNNFEGKYARMLSGARSYAEMQKHRGGGAGGTPKHYSQQDEFLLLYRA